MFRTSVRTCLMMILVAISVALAQQNSDRLPTSASKSDKAALAQLRTLSSSSVFFQTHEVRLGTPVLKTLADLSALGFTFQAIPHADSNDALTHWIVWPPADRSDSGGHLYARNDIIVGIEHQLLRHETLKDFYDALFNALSEISKESGTTCSVKTVRPTISNGIVTLISIGCSGITITVNHADFKDEQGKINESYEVTETIGVIK